MLWGAGSVKSLSAPQNFIIFDDTFLKKERSLAGALSYDIPVRSKAGTKTESAASPSWQNPSNPRFSI